MWELTVNQFFFYQSTFQKFCSSESRLLILFCVNAGIVERRKKKIAADNDKKVYWLYLINMLITIPKVTNFDDESIIIQFASAWPILWLYIFNTMDNVTKINFFSIQKNNNISKEISITSWSKLVIRIFEVLTLINLIPKMRKFVGFGPITFNLFIFQKCARGLQNHVLASVVQYIHNTDYKEPSWPRLSLKLNTNTFITKNCNICFSSYWEIGNTIFHHGWFVFFFLLK